MIRFPCPKCGAKLKAPIGTEGRQATCKCGAGVVVPQVRPIVPVLAIDEPPSLPGRPMALQYLQADANRIATLLNPDPPSIPKGAKRRYGKRLVYAAVAGFLFLGAVVPTVTHYYRATPNANDQAAPGIFGGVFAAPKPGPSMANFAKIKIGMSGKDVTAIMGPAGEAVMGGADIGWSSWLRYESIGHIDFVSTWQDEDGHAYSVGFMFGRGVDEHGIENADRVAAKGPFFVDRTRNGIRSSEKRGGP